MKFIRSLFLCFLFFFTIHPASAQDLTDFVPITSETSGVENSPSDPATCNGANIGRLYFNTVSNRLFVCNGTEFVVSTDDMNRTVFVDSTRPTRAGEVYATLATAVAYINTQTPTSINPFAIVVQQGTNSESVTLSAHTVLAGTHRTKNTFTGTITLSNGSAVQDVTVSGSLNIENGNTGHVTSSDVVLGDGGGGGIDGNLTIHNSLVDGSIAASSIVTALSSQLGVAVLVNAGTINTYSSSVFNLSGAGVWNNFSVAYDNLLQSSADRLDAETLQQAIDEMIHGSPADNFILNKNQSIADDVTLQFGNLVIESLMWDEAQDYFLLSDSLVVDGNVNLQGTIFRLDSDEAGNPDQDLEIVAEQGSEADGVIRYDDGNNRWEISNNGGPFAAISTGGGGSSDFEGVYSTDADKVLTTTNGIFTVNTGTNDFVVDSADWNVSSTGALDVATITSNGLLTGSGGATVSAGTINFNASSNFATNINTGTSTGAVTIGGGSGTVAVNSTSWDISTSGVATGFTGITSTGAVDFSGAANISIPHSNSPDFTLDNDNVGAGVNISIIANQGSNPDGTIRYNTTTNQWEMSNDGGGYVPLAGWYGSQTRIKIMATDFQSDDGDDNFVILSNGTQSSASSGTTDALAMMPLPSGYRATAVQIYGSDTNNPVTVYANEIDDGTTATVLGSGTVIGEIDITDTDSSSTNYLSIYVDLGGGDDIYGGYITIVPTP